MIQLDVISISNIVSRHVPGLQAIYLYGSAADPAVSLDAVGDIDIAILSSPGNALKRTQLMLSNLRSDLEDMLEKPVDISDLRSASVIFCIEVIDTGTRIYTADEFAADTFEMLSLSYYQELNQQRAGILADILSTKRAVQI